MVCPPSVSAFPLLKFGKTELLRPLTYLEILLGLHFVTVPLFDSINLVACTKKLYHFIWSVWIPAKRKEKINEKMQIKITAYQPHPSPLLGRAILSCYSQVHIYTFLASRDSTVPASQCFHPLKIFAGISRIEGVCSIHKLLGDSDKKIWKLFSQHNKHYARNGVQIRYLLSSRQ